jgi:hypothetical protein
MRSVKQSSRKGREDANHRKDLYLNEGFGYESSKAEQQKRREDANHRKD